MKLYGSPASQPSRICLSVAKIANVPVELVAVDLLAGAQKSPEHLALNPLGKVPVLVDGDFVLTESLAICRYILDVKAPGNTLYPTDVKTRYKIDQLLGALNDLRNASRAVAMGRVMLPRMGKKMPEVLINFAENGVKNGINAIEAANTGKKYAYGDGLTLVDIFFTEYLNQSVFSEWDMEKENPGVYKYYNDILAEVPVLKEQSEVVKAVAAKVKAAQ